MLSIKLNGRIGFCGYYGYVLVKYFPIILSSLSFNTVVTSVYYR